MATFRRENQALEDARTVRIVEDVLRRAFPTAQQMNRVPQLGDNIVNGYRDEDGNFIEYWMMGDIVTDDDTTKPLAP